MKSEEINLEDVLTDRFHESDILEVPVSNFPLKVFWFLVVILSLIIVGQLFYIGIFKNDFYVARAFLNMNDIKTLPAPRGIIFDRFGKPLVKNEAAYKVFLSPSYLPDSPVERREELEKIAEFLGVDKDELDSKLQEKDWNLSNKLFLTDDFSEDKLITLRSLNIKPLVVEAGFRRAAKVPYKFSHLVGFTGLVSKEDLKANAGLEIDEEIGKSGLEAYYDSYLRGENGKEIRARNARGQPQEIIRVVAPKPGSDLETFIDREFQNYFHDRLEAGLAVLGRTVGVGLALNPQNGEVLAMVNIPGFDSRSIAQSLKNKDNPFFNRPISGLYNPGSTLKPLHALAALAEGVISPSKQIFSAGFIEVPNPYFPENPSRFLDWKAHGWVDLRGALARSSNIYFYEIAGGFEDQKGLGIYKLNDWWRRFNLHHKTEIDLLGEKSGFLPDPEWKEAKTGEPWRIGDTYNVAIGQGDILVTPIGLLNYINAIATGGKIYKPRIMKAIVGKDGKTLLKSVPETLKDLSFEIKDFVFEVQEGMRDSVRKPYGTAHLLNDLPVEVAAKTGTAQVENNSKTNAFFVGYAPYKNPQISILVLVENSREGSLNTLPIARDVLLWYYENRLKKPDHK